MNVRTASVLLIFACLTVAGCGGGSSPAGPSSAASTNRSPVVASMSVSPTFGVSGLTTITMQASGTDADGDAMTYAWTFDGGTATGASTSAKVTGDGPVTVQVTVSDGKGGTATSSRTVTIGTMTGSWDFIAGPCGTDPREKPAVFVLTQTGTTVRGVLNFPGYWCNVGPGAHSEIPTVAPGSIDDQGNFTLPRIAISVFQDSRLFGGKMSDTGRVVTGRIYDSGFTGETFTMTKK